MVFGPCGCEERLQGLLHFTIALAAAVAALDTPAALVTAAALAAALAALAALIPALAAAATRLALRDQLE